MVSVIIPNYNSIKTIKQCLESIANQTYKNIEILIIDDCSTDNCLEEIAKFENLNIILIKNIKNLGPGKCRNIGLKKSTGDYVAFLDSDDFWSPNHLEVLIDNFQLNCNYQFLFSKVLVTHGGNLSRRFQLNRVTKNLLLLTTPIVTSSVIIRRDLIKKLEFKQVVYDDLLFWYECIEKCGVAYKVNNYGTYYRITKNSYSSDKIKSSIEVYKMYLKYFKLNFIEANLFFISYIFFGLYKKILQSFTI